MKNPTLLLMVLLIAAAFAANVNYESRCKLKSYEVWRTIGGFCGKTDMIVPSDYASEGNAILDKGIVVTIGGTIGDPT